MLEDLYSDDLIGDPRTQNDEEGSGALFWEEERENREEGSGNDDNGVPDYDVAQNDPQASQTVEPKRKRVVQNPQPKLNPDRLKGSRGVAILENVFKDMKFSGKGCEKKDLNQVMKRLEHWAHRLFPKFQFDDCLEKIETLGHKKPVMTYVKRIRMGLETAETATAVDILADEQNVPDNDLNIDLQSDPFDDLLAQQVVQSQQWPQHSSAHPVSPHSPVHPPKSSLTEEQKERMRRNRLIAEQRLMARLKATQQNQSSSDLLTSPGSATISTAADKACSFRAQSQEDETWNTLTRQSVCAEETMNVEFSEPGGNGGMTTTDHYEVSQEYQLSQRSSEHAVCNEQLINEDVLMSPTTVTKIGENINNETQNSQEVIMQPIEKETDSHYKCSLSQEGFEVNASDDREIHSQILQVLQTSGEQPSETETNPNEQRLSSEEETEMEVMIDNELCSQQTSSDHQHENRNEELSLSKKKGEIEMTDKEIHIENQQVIQTTLEQPTGRKPVEKTDCLLQDDRDKAMEVASNI